jgi:hypothetical protein
MGHALPHAPQFVVVLIDVHTPPQSTRPDAQVQVPFTQLAPVAQRLPQLPQFVVLTATSTHVVPHTVPIAPGQVQVPPMQVEVEGHVLPQLPQWAFEVVVSTQRPLHEVAPPGQRHEPALQV